ncbi:MAG: hypothetical protein ACFNPV_11605, partial [Corynebacterium matruchotii]
AGGVAQHGAHAREVILSLKFAAEGRLKLPLQSIVSAVGVSNTAAYGTMAGMLLCVGWAGLATIIGLGRVKTYNL